MKRTRRATPRAAGQHRPDQVMVGAWVPRPTAEKSAIAIRALAYKNMRAFIQSSLEGAIAEAIKRGYPLEDKQHDDKHHDS